MHDRSYLIKKASIIAIIGNFILAVSKIIIGVFSGSLAVVSDGVDSSTDVLIAIMTFCVARISHKPGDKEHPYGHARAETMATTILAFIVFFAGSQLFLAAFKGLVFGEKDELPSLVALWVTIFSICGKLFLVWSQFHYGKLAGSGMLKANGKNMQGDVITSVSVLTGLVIGQILNLPILDHVLALLVSLWIIKNSISIFLETNMELMDGSKDKGPYAEVFKAISTIDDAVNPHRTRIRRLGSMLIVDTDIEVEPSMSVNEAHNIAVNIEKAIKKNLPEVYDVIVHIEPKGNIEDDERYGLTPTDQE